MSSTYAWRGAVEPADASPSGNEVRLYRGAIEVAVYVLTGTSVVSTSEVSNPALTMNYNAVRRLFQLTGSYDPDVSLTGESN